VQYDASYDQELHKSHADKNAAAHAKLHKSDKTRKSSPKTHQPRGVVSTRLGHANAKWFHGKQIAFAVNRLAGVRGVGPPHFREAHNVLSPQQVEQAKAVFNTWDKNHDGGIDRSELGHAMHSVIESMQHVAAQTGGHTAVKIGLEKEDVHAFVEDIFDKADWNSDACLDINEFVEIYNTIAINCIDYNEML